MTTSVKIISTQVTICHWIILTLLILLVSQSPTYQILVFYTMNLLMMILENLTKYLTRIRVLSIEEFITPHLIFICIVPIRMPFLPPFPSFFYVFLFPFVTIVNAIVSLILCPFIDLYDFLSSRVLTK
ncbi:hypothetical protein B9Z55_011589 [Caenorhabditis nigoni]|uniref:Uncharacterized protein n=1 Tax=Caenorhabditis nigoni TaxID=1611254 RepID=A0A2G5UKV0_9PELO|nr:hypothetical protein B9Z55_011589 [Caenorhabditis nigoni]